MSNTTRNWTDDPDKLLRWQLMDWLIIPEDRDGANMSELVSKHEAEENAVLVAAEWAERQGFLRIDSDFEESWVKPLPEGEAFHRKTELDRNNRLLRSIACQEALIDWLYQYPDATDIDHFEGNVRAHILGAPFTNTEINETAMRLFDDGLITGTRSWGGAIHRLSITSEGAKLVEQFDGSMDKYHHRDNDRGLNFTANIGTINGGQVGIGQNVQQSQNDNYQTQTSICGS